jgi:Protein of unknown function (DUF2877)
VSPTVVPCAASTLLAAVLDQSRSTRRPLVEVARTRTSVHYATGLDGLPVLCVSTPTAVRLPAALLSGVLPSGPVALRDGGLSDGVTAWRVVRWWQPPRPLGLRPPRTAPEPSGVDVVDEIRPRHLVGLGPGLTPAGDDLVAGALVAASATADPRHAGYQDDTRAALRLRPTTAVSRALLHHALQGYSTPELAAYVHAVCAGDAARALSALLAVGHSSGAALAAGALHVLSTTPETRRSAA